MSQHSGAVTHKILCLIGRVWSPHTSKWRAKSSMPSALPTQFSCDPQIVCFKPEASFSPAPPSTQQTHDIHSAILVARTMKGTHTKSCVICDLTHQGSLTFPGVPGSCCVAAFEGQSMGPLRERDENWAEGIRYPYGL